MDSLRARLRCFRRLMMFIIVCLATFPFVAVLSILEFLLSRLSDRLWLLYQPLVMIWRAKVMQNMCRTLCAVCGIRLHVDDHDGGSEKVNFPARRGEPMLILANHICYLDVVAIGSLIPCSFLAKSEVRDWPLIGSLTAGLGCMYLDRDSLSGRTSALLKLRRRLRLQSVCVFPEGTTTSRRAPCPTHWKFGQTWASDSTHESWPGIRAVSIQYNLHDEMVWVDDMEFLPHLLKVLTLPRIEVRLSTRILAGAKVAQMPVRERSLSVCHELASLSGAGI